MSQTTIDERNAAFWNTLCGSALARGAGITGAEPHDLEHFDAVYLDHYPYLSRYVDADLGSKRVLEIGLGYGTLGSLLVARGADYHGVDIAAEPVAVMQRRLELAGRSPETVVQASALDLPHDDASFDRIYAIGCLHHTGDLPRAVAEVHRVLRPGGRTVVMVYNRWSARRVIQNARNRLSPGSRSDEHVRSLYDADESGAAAPHTDYVSVREARRLFAAFSNVRVEIRNFDDYRIRGRLLSRRRFLGTVDRVAGLDLYVVATR